MKLITRNDAEHVKHKALFELIQNKEHWKQAIDCWIPVAMQLEFSNAAAYFHGRALKIGEVSECGNYIHVASAGYACW